MPDYEPPEVRQALSAVWPDQSWKVQQVIIAEAMKLVRIE